MKRLTVLALLKSESPNNGVQFRPHSSFHLDVPKNLFLHLIVFD